MKTSTYTFNCNLDLLIVALLGCLCTVQLGGLEPVGPLQVTEAASQLLARVKLIHAELRVLRKKEEEITGFAT